MARDSGDIDVEQIPSIISDILMEDNLARKDQSSVHIFDNIVQSFSQQNCSEMPPLLLTTHDREELQRDRENAMECERKLAKKKQEQYFLLVDQIQNVLRRIEKKNSLKSNKPKGKEVYNSTSRKSPSDCNNNPSPKHPDIYTENEDLSSTPKHPQRTYKDPVNWENMQPVTNRQRNNTSRYSLPANFETMFSPDHGEKNGNVLSSRYHTSSNTQRPVSAYSDHRLVYDNHNGRWYGSGPEILNHQQSSNHQRPSSMVLDNHCLYGSSNGYPGSGPDVLHHQHSGNQTPSLVPDNHHLYGRSNGYRQSNNYHTPHSHVLQQAQNQRPLSAYSDHNSSSINGFENPNQHIREAVIPHKTNSSSPISQSDENQNSISKQKEFLALEQKRLEDHYAVLQDQLLADFQKRQHQLLEIYNKSLDSQTPPDRTMQSILERSFESSSDGTLVSSTTVDKENFTIVQTEEFPQSPFSINIMKKSPSLQNGEARKNYSRSVQDPTGDKRIFSQNSCGNAPVRNSAKLQDSSPSNARFLQNSQKFVSPEKKFPKSFGNSQNSLNQNQRSKNSSMYSNSSSIDTRRSFNSEVSAQEYYEMPSFVEKPQKTEIVENKSERNLKRDSTKNDTKSGRNVMKNFGANVITSPKRTQLNSFESQAMKNLKNSHKFCLVSSHAKGFLTRLLFQTAKIQGLKTTIKDARNVLAEMNTESTQSITDRTLKERVKTQLHSAQSELRRIFVDSPPHVRMQILEQNRKQLKEKQARNASKFFSSGNSPQNRPKLSNVTMKKRLSRQEIQEKTPKTGKPSTPNSGKVSRGSLKERNTPKSLTKNSPTISAKASPINKTKKEVPVKCESADIVEETSSDLAETKRKTNATSVINTSTATTTRTSSGTAGIDRKIEIRKQPVRKLAKNKPSVKSSKPTRNVSQTSNDRRKTWDSSVLKPIQGRISPTIPTEKIRSSNEKRQSTLSAARKVGQTLLSEFQSNGISAQSNTCEVSGIDMSKTYKINNKPDNPIKKTGAKRSLAANLSNK